MNQELNPKVSIVLPTYNGAKYIRQSIASCLNQTYKNIELIIVDDGSTDDTPEIIKSYQDERIKYLRHEKNKGLPHALNTGFANATGEYLTWTSDDNYYAEEAIERMLSFLKSKNYSFVYCDFYVFKDNNLSNIDIVKLPDVLALGNHNDVGACFLYSRAIKETIGDYDPDVVLAEDYDYWIRVSKKFSMHHLNEPLYFFRQHEESLYRTRYYEVKVADFLVRIKNNISDVEQVTSLFINLVAQKKIGRFKLIRILNGVLFRLNKALAKILVSKRINAVLKDYESEKISFMHAKSELKSIVDNYLT